MNEFTRPARTPYADPLPDTGHVMQALTRLEGKVDNLASLFRQLLGRLAEDDEGEPEDLTLEGGPAGAERDQNQSLDAGTVYQYEARVVDLTLTTPGKGTIRLDPIPEAGPTKPR